MLFKSVLASAFLATGAFAQYGDSSSSSSSSSGVQVQVVQVSNANGSLSYTPSIVSAAPGSFVQFQFWPKNHTVTQSTFADPCTPISKSMPNVTNMVKSGFVPVAAGASEVPVFTVQINDTKPIWVYCSQTGHCQKGMVMAINSNESSANNFAAFQAAAMATTSAASNSSSTTSNSSSGSSSSSGTSSSSPATQSTSAGSKPMVAWIGLAISFVAGYAMLL